MPTYEYACGACGHEFEVFQKMSEDPVSECPRCGEHEAERQISAGGGLVFRGSGFYATDYREPPPGQEAADDGPGSSEEEGGADSAPADADD